LIEFALNQIESHIEIIPRSFIHCLGEETSLGGEETSLGGEVTSLGGEVTSLGGEVTSLGGEETSLGGEVTSLGVILLVWKYPPPLPWGNNCYSELRKT